MKWQILRNWYIVQPILRQGGFHRIKATGSMWIDDGGERREVKTERNFAGAEDKMEHL